MAVKVEWREIPNHPGYFVSEHGVIASANFGRTAMVLRDDGTVGPPDGRVLLVVEPSIRPDGYPTVGLRNVAKGYHTGYLVHRLVAAAFLGAPESHQIQVAHLDGDRGNPSANNLRWASSKENNSHKQGHGTQPQGEKSHWAKLTDEQAAEIRRLYATGEYYQTQLGAMFGVSQGAISHITRGDRRVAFSGPRVSFGRGARVRGKQRAELSETQAKEIRGLYATGRWTQGELAKMFETSRTVICHVTTGKSFKSAGGPMVKFRPGPRDGAGIHSD